MITSLLLILVLLSQSHYWLDMTKPTKKIADSITDLDGVRINSELSAAEIKRGCWLDFSVDDKDRLMMFRCPNPFSPYGVDFYKFCIVKENEFLSKIKIAEYNKRKVVSACEVKER